MDYFWSIIDPVLLKKSDLRKNDLKDLLIDWFDFNDEDEKEL